MPGGVCERVILKRMAAVTLRAFRLFVVVDVVVVVSPAIITSRYLRDASAKESGL